MTNRSSSSGCCRRWSDYIIIFLHLTIFNCFDLILKQRTWVMNILFILISPRYMLKLPLTFSKSAIRRHFVPLPLQNGRIITFKYINILNSMLELWFLPLLLQKSDALNLNINRVSKVRTPSNEWSRCPLKLLGLFILGAIVSSFHNWGLRVVPVKGWWILILHRSYGLIICLGSAILWLHGTTFRGQHNIAMHWLFLCFNTLIRYSLVKTGSLALRYFL